MAATAASSGAALIDGSGGSSSINSNSSSIGMKRRDSSDSGGSAPQILSISHHLNLNQQQQLGALTGSASIGVSSLPSSASDAVAAAAAAGDGAPPMSRSSLDSRPQQQHMQQRNHSSHSLNHDSHSYGHTHHVQHIAPMLGPNATSRRSKQHQSPPTPTSSSPGAGSVIEFTRTTPQKMAATSRGSQLRASSALRTSSSVQSGQNSPTVHSEHTSASGSLGSPPPEEPSTLKPVEIETPISRKPSGEARQFPSAQALAMGTSGPLAKISRQPSNTPPYSPQQSEQQKHIQSNTQIYSHSAKQGENNVASSYAAPPHPIVSPSASSQAIPISVHGETAATRFITRNVRGTPPGKNSPPPILMHQQLHQQLHTGQLLMNSQPSPTTVYGPSTAFSLLSSSPQSMVSSSPLMIPITLPYHQHHYHHNQMQQHQVLQQVPSVVPAMIPYPTMEQIVHPDRNFADLDGLISDIVKRVLYREEQSFSDDGRRIQGGDRRPPSPILSPSSTPTRNPRRSSNRQRNPSVSSASSLCSHTTSVLSGPISHPLPAADHVHITLNVSGATPSPQPVVPPAFPGGPVVVPPPAAPLQLSLRVVADRVETVNRLGQAKSRIDFRRVVELSHNPSSDDAWTSTPPNGAGNTTSGESDATTTSASSSSTSVPPETYFELGPVMGKDVEPSLAEEITSVLVSVAEDTGSATMSITVRSYVDSHLSHRSSVIGADDDGTTGGGGGGGGGGDTASIASGNSERAPHRRPVKRGSGWYGSSERSPCGDGKACGGEAACDVWGYNIGPAEICACGRHLAEGMRIYKLRKEVTSWVCCSANQNNGGGVPLSLVDSANVGSSVVGSARERYI